MKKNYLFIFFAIIETIIFTNSSMAQTVNFDIKFTANADGNFIALDSIFVRNNTKNWELMLNAPDTTLILYYDITGINQAENRSFNINANKPNPFDGSTNVEMQFTNNEQVEFALCDLSGRVYLTEKHRVEAGNYNLEVSVSKAQPYLLQIKTNTESRTIKLLCRNAKGNNNFNFTKQGDAVIKQLKFDTQNDFNPEDNFTFIGYSSYNGWFVMTDTITETINENNQTFIFNYYNPIELTITNFDIENAQIEWISIQASTSADSKVADAKQDRNDIQREGNTLYIQLYTISENIADIQEFRETGEYIIVLKHDQNSKMYIKGALGGKPEFTNGQTSVEWGGIFQGWIGIDAK